MAEYNANCSRCDKPPEDGDEVIVIHHKIFLKLANGWALPHRNEIQASRVANGLEKISEGELPDRFTWIHAACLVPGVWGPKTGSQVYGKLRLIKTKDSPGDDAA